MHEVERKRSLDLVAREPRGAVRVGERVVAPRQMMIRHPRGARLHDACRVDPQAGVMMEAEAGRLLAALRIT